MVRSVGITAVVLSLAWTGLAGAQLSSPWGTSASPPRYIIVSEEGRTPQRCKVINTWKDADGRPAFQVQAVDTGEQMTIVGTSPQAGAGGPREMTTRIFRWGRDNKPPVGAPLPPSTAAASTTTLTPPPTRTAPQSVRPVPVATVSRTAPVSSPTDSTSKSAPSAIVAKPDPLIAKKPQSPTLMSTQVIQHSPASDYVQLPPADLKTTPTQPRLLPLASGSDANQKPCNCTCPTPCDSCGKTCNPCCQPSCVCGTPSPMRQPLISRLFKSNSGCTSTTVVCQPAPDAATKPVAATPLAPTPPTTGMVQSATEPAKPGDWHQSWGNVEPWKTKAQASSVRPVELAKRADPTPVQMGPSTQPDPLQAPSQYHDMAMNAQLANSKIPQASRPSVVSRLKDRLQSAKQPAEGAMVANAPLPNGAMPSLIPPGQPPIRTVQVEANEPNAFWAPVPPPSAGPKTNAFNRDANAPPQGVPPTIAGVPPTIAGVPPAIAGAGFVPMPPHGPMLQNPPRPPQAPYARSNGPMQPMSPDTGVPESMGNAFTLAGTRRPIPADFGGTPQETNGFDPPEQAGQGSPPRAYGMATQGMPRPPMPNMVAMGPQTAVAHNPLMSVPPVPSHLRDAAFASESARPAGVPQLLTALKDALGPSEREAAAEKLSELNWHAQPLVVESLMKAARTDPAATVRATCVHALSHMGVNTAEAVALVRDLKSDRDPLVRQEAEEALNALGDSGIQQASHK